MLCEVSTIRIYERTFANLQKLICIAFTCMLGLLMFKRYCCLKQSWAKVPPFCRLHNVDVATCKLNG